MRLRLFFSALGAASAAIALWCCSDADPVGSSTPDSGSETSLDANGGDSASPPAGDAGAEAGCVMSVTGARTGQYPCKATSSQSVGAEDAGQWLVDTLSVVSADPQSPTSLSKVIGLRCLGSSAPKVGPNNGPCQCGFGEVAQDGGQAGQWANQVAAMRVDSVSVSGPPELFDASGVTVTPLTVHGVGFCDAPDTLGNAAPVRLEVRF